MRILRQAIFVVFAITLASAQDSVWATKKSGWQLLTPDQRSQVETLADHFKSYLDISRNAYTSTKEVVK